MEIYAHTFLIPHDPPLRVAVSALIGPHPVRISPQGDKVMIEHGAIWSSLCRGHTPRKCLEEITLSDRIDQLVRTHLFEHHPEEAKSQNFSTQGVAASFQHYRVRSLTASRLLHEVWYEPQPFLKKIWIIFLSSFQQVWFGLAAYFLSSDGHKE